MKIEKKIKKLQSIKMQKKTMNPNKIKTSKILLMDNNTWILTKLNTKKLY